MFCLLIFLAAKCCIGPLICLPIHPSIHHSCANGPCTLLQDKVDCACTKISLSKLLGSSVDRPNNLPPGYTVYTGDNHPSNSLLKPNDGDGGREGKVCQKCGVPYQQSSFISDMFEGIHQVDVICAKVGIILHTDYQRFTSLSIPHSASGEITLEVRHAWKYQELQGLLTA